MSVELVQAAALLGAGIAALGGVGAGLGQGIATAYAVEAVSRQPEARSSIMNTLFIGCAITESTGIYALVISLLLILLKG
ncbi:ATP synthase F0 subunit C [Oceanivirga miroungae]|uniref:ATP synthase subunit c n=1 Tax=Oceanivirga miroungae TaxID=1130046 RepID=A0A6I8M6A4_9FUSO|nr:ATP synthase F0 subunit C [Oceanivirga miroungae]VWL84891.1 ATP synthase F0 C subunit [Oceanivirga miroungae]